MSIEIILFAPKIQSGFQLTEVGRSKLFEVIGEVFYKWSLVQRISSEARERVLAFPIF